MRWVTAASLAVNLALALVCVSRRIKPRVPEVPSRGEARAALFRELAAGPSAHRDVVVLGDSLTERGEWWELLDRPVANRGIGGDSVESVRARLDDIVALEPRVLFVLVGVNDLLAGASPELLASRHTELVVDLRRRMPRTRIVVESLLPIRDQLIAPEETLSTATVRRANELLQRAAIGAGADWLDVNTPMTTHTGELDPRYSSDGLHLSASGYRAWAANLQPYLP